MITFFSLKKCNNIKLKETSGGKESRYYLDAMFIRVTFIWIEKINFHKKLFL